MNSNLNEHTLPTPIELKKKYQLRRKLATELAEFLSNPNNKITTLKAGEKAPPIEKSNANEKVIFKETSEQEILEKNRIISKVNASTTKKKINEMEENKKRLNRSTQLKNRTSQASKVKKPKPKTPIDPIESERIKEVRRLSGEAKKNGVSQFLAPCKIHGMTTYKHHGDSSRCIACNIKMGERYRNRFKTDEEIQDTKRKKENQKRMQQALANNLEEFDAECRNCGITAFKLKKRIDPLTSTPRYSHYCKFCTNTSLKKQDKKRAEARRLKRESNWL